MNPQCIFNDDNCIFDPSQSYFILKSSFLFLLSSFHSIYNMHYDLSLIGVGLFITSINYWRKPLYKSWRKDLDVNYVRFALLYYFYKSYHSDYFITYNTIMTISILFYPFSIYLYNKKLYWYSVYAHSTLHLGATCASIILQSGYIPPIYKIN